MTREAFEFRLTDYPDVALVEVKSATKALWAYCRECDSSLGSPYWPLSKSVYMHKWGTGHNPTLLTFKS